MIQTVSVGGLNIEYLDIQTSDQDLPTLILLHEGLGSVAMWRDFPSKLAEISGCRVIAYSRPGYGQSDAYTQPRTPQYMHDEAVLLPKLMQALQLQKAVLLGHSDGASIALLAAAMFPELFQGIVVMAPHLFVEEETLAGIRQAAEVWKTTDWSRRLARYHQDANRVFSDWQNIWLSPTFSDWNIESYLPKIYCPALAIQGEGDEYATMRQIDVIAEQVLGAKLLKLPDCGHSPQRDQEQKILDALVRFVDSLPAAP